MSYSVQKSTVAKVAVVSLAMLLAACSSDQRYKRQVSGDEAYLQTTPLADLHAPAGMILPVQNGRYDIPVVRSSTAIGKELDIRPPTQALALVNGGRTSFAGDTATLLVDAAMANGLWPQVVSILQEKNYTITERSDGQQTLTTDWIEWERADEDQLYRGRYQISVLPQGYQQSIVVKLLGLEQNGQAVSDPVAVQRYSSAMLNRISLGLDNAQTTQQNLRDNRSVSGFDVQSSADDTGLPMLVVRAPFNAVWNKLPTVLQKVGMKVTDETRSKGNIVVTYKPLSDSEWMALGAKDPGLDGGSYKLQIGDLDNRSSMQFIDPKGHALTQSQNDALVAVFQAAFNQ